MDGGGGARRDRSEARTLNSSSVMLECTCRNSGESWYFRNSTCGRRGTSSADAPVPMHADAAPGHARRRITCTATRRTGGTAPSASRQAPPTCQSSSVSGGASPVNFHSVMESPERVSLVTPPMTTSAATQPLASPSQVASWARKRARKRAGGGQRGCAAGS